MKEMIDQAIDKMNKALEAMDKKLVNIRAGRANTAVLDGIKVSYYGMDTPLVQLASVSIPEARVLSIKPFDRSSISNIEKAIFEANIGLTPTNNGETVILNFPPLTEERRKDYVKQAKGVAEESKIAIRIIRQDTMNAIKKEEFPQDEERRGLDQIQELVEKYNVKIEDKLKHKEEELMIV